MAARDWLVFNFFKKKLDKKIIIIIRTPNGVLGLMVLLEHDYWRILMVSFLEHLHRASLRVSKGGATILQKTVYKVCTIRKVCCVSFALFAGPTDTWRSAIGALFLFNQKKKIIYILKRKSPNE